jgi:site-specific DNA-methyltransferase (adenine-specific)
MEGMKQYPDKYFDLAVVDPPYGLGNRLSDGGGKLKNTPMAALYRGKEWDVLPSKEYFKELFRVSENQIICGANYFLEHLPSSRGCICWDKKQDMPTLSAWEFIWTSFDKPAKIYKQVSTDLNRFHPTQKPVKLYEWIYSKYLYCKYCNNTGSYYEDVCGDGGPQMLQSCDCVLGEGRNYRVIDTHLGSGSNRIAADKAGNIDFYGWEIDKDYYEAQEKRWEDYKAQLTMF